MWVRYKEWIRESAEELETLERAQRDSGLAKRLQVLRLLKSGQCRSLRAVAPVVGYHRQQIGLWLAQYRKGGLDALLERKPRPGKSPKLTSEAWAALQEEMRAGRIGTLEEARRYLESRWNIVYGSVNGIWWHFRKFRVRLKTGRRRHRKADAAQQEALKKTSRPSLRVLNTDSAQMKGVLD